VNVQAYMVCWLRLTYLSGLSQHHDRCMGRGADRIYREQGALRLPNSQLITTALYITKEVNLGANLCNEIIMK